MVVSACRLRKTTQPLCTGIYRGYYTVARRYEYYFRVVKQTFFLLHGQKSEQANTEHINPAGKHTRFSCVTILTRENMENTSVLVNGKTPITI